MAAQYAPAVVIDNWSSSLSIYLHVLPPSRDVHHASRK